MFWTNKLQEKCTSRSTKEWIGKAPGIVFRLWILPVLILVSFTGQGLAQSHLTLYNFREIPQAHHLNPAFSPSGQWHLGIPLLSRFEAGLGSKPLHIDHIGSRGWTLAFDQPVLFRELLNEVQDRNLAVGEAGTDLISFGYRLGANYLTLSVSEQFEGSFRYSDDFIQINADEADQVYAPGSAYDLSRLRLRATHYRSFALGLKRAVSKDLHLGWRVKFLLGMENLWSNNDGLRLSILGETTGIYRLDGQIELLSGGLSTYSDVRRVTFINRYINTGNYGIAADLGFSYQASDKFNLAGSAINLGGILWRKRVNYRIINTLFEQLEEGFNRVIDELVDGVPPTSRTYRTSLHPQFFLSGTYSFNPANQVGLLFHTRLVHDELLPTAAVAFRTQLKKWLNLSVNYSANANSYHNFGLGGTIQLGAVQLYGTSDNVISLFKPGRQNNIHFIGGINILIGNGEKEESPAVAQEEPGTDSISLEPQPSLADRNEAFPGISEAFLKKNFLFSGTVKDQLSRENLEYVFVDVYKHLPNGLRELVHTLRYPGPEFSFWLARGQAHEIQIESGGYQLLTYFIGENEAGIGVDRRDEEFLMQKMKKPVLPPKQLEGVKLTSAPAGTPQTGQPAEISSENPEKATAESWYFNITTRTSLRQEANSAAPILIRLGVGSRVKLLEETNSFWWQVDYEGMTGWVKRALLEPSN